MRKQKIVILMLLLVLAYLVAPSRGKDTRTNTTERKEKKLLTKIEIKKEQVSTSSRSSKSRNNVRETETTATVIENWMIGYVTDNVNIRKEPNTNSEIYGLFDFNTCVTYAQYNNEWIKVKFNDNIAYMSSLYLTDTSCISAEYNVPDNNGFKSYMPYDAITNRESLQYKLQHEYAYSGNCGIRQVNGRYCVAIGTAFGTQIGDYIDLVLENGEVIKAIVSDIKADKDTDYRNIVTMHNGCVSEFIVDTSALMHEINLHGDVSVATTNWNSKVCKIRVYEKNIFTN